MMEELTRSEARNGLLAFTKYTMPGFQPGRHHAIIARELELVENGDVRRLIIQAPPRHTKSELSSRRFPAWYLGRHPGRQIICASHTQDLADDFGREVRQIVKDPEFRRLFPGVELSADSQAKANWITNKGGRYLSVGIDGNATGRGAHVALIDDPIKDRKSAESETIRNAVWNWYRSVLRTRMMPNGAIVLILTRWHEDDLAGRLLEEAKKGGEPWRVVSLPAISEQGEALWPEWFPLEELDAVRRTLGPRDWSSLYMQNPTPSDGTEFRAEWWRYYDTPPTNLTIYITGDFAVTEDDGDYSAIIVWGIDHLGNVYALDRFHGRVKSDQLIMTLVRMFERWKPHGLRRFVGEAGPIRRSVEPFLERTMRDRNVFVPLEWLPSVSDKVTSSFSFQGLMASGRVYWPRTEWAEQVKAELLKFPAGKNDDQVDACSLLGRYIDEVYRGQPPKPEPKPHDFARPMTMGELIPRPGR